MEGTEANAFHGRISRSAREIEERWGKVERANNTIHLCARGHPRGMKDEWNVVALIPSIERQAVTKRGVWFKLVVAMIGGDEDDRVVHLSSGSEGIKDPAHIVVKLADTAVVESFNLRDFLGSHALPMSRSCFDRR